MRKEIDCRGCILLEKLGQLPPKCQLQRLPLYQIVSCETGVLVKAPVSLPPPVYEPRITSPQQIKNEIRDNVALVTKIAQTYML